MYDLAGCLILIVLTLLALALLKELWWLIVGTALIFIAAYWGRRIYMLFAKGRAAKQKDYTPAMGEVYKVCPYCSAKVQLQASECPVCRNKLN